MKTGWKTIKTRLELMKPLKKVRIISLAKSKISDKLRAYMVKNNYYELVIPLIRKISPSYDAYYKKLLEANEKFLREREK